MSKRVYISGKITGTTDYFVRFGKAEQYLISQGYTVVNPAKVNAEMPNDLSWEEYMHMCRAMVDMCDAIFMLKDWEYSKGANEEYGWAVNDKMEILYEEDVNYGN